MLEIKRNTLTLSVYMLHCYRKIKMRLFVIDFAFLSFLHVKKEYEEDRNFWVTSFYMTIEFQCLT